ncbi:hypothetical protein QYE76_016226 [Lolium multiflorum]|uniref:Uncharacterized protein n=1 Tax=Lolium multiflorum TaxID=4521 RepID=A0AAD8XAI9_LOLMU|nr:hypothetical protein QYE76_016226 [Lolium multiflorum]
MTAQQYITEMKGFSSEFAVAGKIVDDDELKDYILNGLDGTFNNLIASINTVPSTTLSDMFSQLLACENHDAMLLSTGETPASFTSSVNAASQRPLCIMGTTTPTRVSRHPTYHPISACLRLRSHARLSNLLQTKVLLGKIRCAGKMGGVARRILVVLQYLGKRACFVRYVRRKGMLLVIVGGVLVVVMMMILATLVSVPME